MSHSVLNTTEKTSLALQRRKTCGVIYYEDVYILWEHKGVSTPNLEKSMGEIGRKERRVFQAEGTAGASSL